MDSRCTCKKVGTRIAERRENGDVHAREGTRG